MPKRGDRQSDYYKALTERYSKRPDISSHERYILNRQITLWLDANDIEYSVNKQNHSVIFHYRMVTYTYYMSTGRLMYIKHGNRTYINVSWQKAVEHIWHFEGETFKASSKNTDLN